MNKRTKKLLAMMAAPPRLRRVSGLPPLSYTAKKAGFLTDYRIYGQTSRNLFDGEIINANIVSDGSIATNVEYSLSIAPVVIGETYTISNNKSINNVYTYYTNKPFLGITTSYDGSRTIFSGESISIVAPLTGYIAVRRLNTDPDIMLNVGSTPLPYEPYGESVGDRTGNLFNEGLYDKNTAANVIVYVPVYVGNVNSVTCSTTCPMGIQEFKPRHIFILTGSVSSGAANNTNGVSINAPLTVAPTDGYVTIAYRRLDNIKPWDYHTMLNTGSTALPYEPYGYRVPVTVEGKNLWPGVVEQGHVSLSGDYGSNTKRIRSKNVPIKPGTYTISGNMLIRSIYAYNDDDKIGLVSDGNYYSRSFAVPAGANNISIGMMKIVDGVQVDITPSDFIWGQIEKGSEATTYEPYHMPVTTPIYLPEQIRKVGDEAEYIDYGSQKQHRVRKNLWSNDIKQLTERTDAGITWSLINGKLSVSGETTDWWSCGNVGKYFDCTGLVGTVYIRIYPQNTKLQCVFYIKKQDGTMVYPQNQYTLDGTEQTARCFVQMGRNISIDPTEVYIFVSLNVTPPDTYEPYIENTDLDVTLPALPTVTGTNVLSVGTEVQPSEVEIKGRIKPVTGGGE